MSHVGRETDLSVRSDMACGGGSGGSSGCSGGDQSCRSGGVGGLSTFFYQESRRLRLLPVALHRQRCTDDVSILWTDSTALRYCWMHPKQNSAKHISD
jgi:hypothetical protein